MNFSLFFMGIFILSFFTTYCVRRYSLQRAILDIPNERSSHSVPTPRGGGMGIALSFFVGLAWLYHLNAVPENITLALSGGILIALVGWLDDIYSLAVRWRLVFHVISALWALYCLNGFPSLSIGMHIIPLNGIGEALATFGIVWCINFYNFMDGIDGLSGSEAIFVSLVAGLLLFSVHSALASICFLLIFACLGFLLWNWPKGKIFMGDVGSSLLGYIFAVLAIASENQHSLPLICWLILLGVFAFDATFTLISRMRQKKTLHLAHREHAYQQLSKLNFSHLRITLSIFIFNCAVLMPLCLLAFFWRTLLLPCLFTAIFLLFFLWRKITVRARNLGP